MIHVIASLVSNRRSGHRLSAGAGSSSSLMSRQRANSGGVSGWR